ncbi:MAG TPA: hypothetical protein VLX44_20305 [Xanthobacteraceae bacterium]|nr:hypothetical protein [Xanthobacteraceae bacterium]
MSMKIVLSAAAGPAVLTMLAAPSFATTYGHRHAKAHVHRHMERMVVRSSAYGSGFDNSARAAFGRSYDFEGWPTDYLINRFGDHQAQGR